METLEYRLEPATRRQYAMRAVAGLILVVLLGGTSIATGSVFPMIFAIASALTALFCGAMWFGRSRALTSVDSGGIETRVFRSRRVAWSDVAEIKVYDFERVGRVGATAGFVGSTGGRRNSGGGNKKVACVKVVRRKGRTIELAAPLVTRDAGDSAFDDKVRALRAAHARHLRGAADRQPTSALG